MFLILHYTLSPSPGCFGYYIGFYHIVLVTDSTYGKLLPSFEYFSYCMENYCPFLSAFSTIICIYHPLLNVLVLHGWPTGIFLGIQHLSIGALVTAWQSLLGDWVITRRSIWPQTLLNAWCKARRSIAMSLMFCVVHRNSFSLFWYEKVLLEKIFSSYVCFR